MITAVRYAEITGDDTTASALVEAAIAEATTDLEEYLDRPLEEAERTEFMRPDRIGRLWPKATPIDEAESYEIDGLALIGPTPFPSFIDPTIGIAVTYTGGWTDETLPLCIQRDLAWAAYRLLHPTAPGTSIVPEGASSVRLGDAAITFGPGGAPDGIGGDTTSWWSSRTKRYRYVPVHTSPDYVAAWP